jgi:death-on-curing protein
LATNHGFVDGNKRTALLTLHILLDRSGYTITAANDDALQHDLETLILNVVTRQINFEDLVAWVKERVRRK